MFLLVALFLILQTDNVIANDFTAGHSNVRQITEEIENFQDEVAEATDKKLGQTEDRSLKEKIYKAFEKIFECTNAIIQKLRSRED